MINVNLTEIHMIMTRNYGTRNMTIETKVPHQHFIKPKEMKIIFDFDSECYIDMQKLNKRIDKHICGVRNYFVSVVKDKIEIQIVFSWGRKLKDYDFEFSLN